MCDVVVKVAPRGEGKTTWLLEKANALKEQKLKLWTKVPQEYSLFCEKYFKLYGHICPVEQLDIECLESEDTVLIDNLLELSEDLLTIAKVKNTAKKIYVTMEGRVE